MVLVEILKRLASENVLGVSVVAGYLEWKYTRKVH